MPTLMSALYADSSWLCCLLPLDGRTCQQPHYTSYYVQHRANMKRQKIQIAQCRLYVGLCCAAQAIKPAVQHSHCHYLGASQNALHLHEDFQHWALQKNRNPKREISSVPTVSAPQPQHDKHAGKHSLPWPVDTRPHTVWNTLTVCAAVQPLTTGMP